MSELPMQQSHYTDLVRGLDRALGAFLSVGKSEDEAVAALRAFIDDHYIPVWRKIAQR